MVEQANGDYARTIVRQFLMDVYNFHLYSQLANSKDETIAGIAQKAIKEVTYHIRHSASWIIRFGEGTQESHQKAQDAMNDLWRFTGELFETDEVDLDLVKKGIAADLTAVKANWEKQIAETFAKATLKIPEGIFMQKGGRKGLHTENLGYILAEMQSLPRSMPNARW
jgi:ring-1,2-phenylacetyl-CoA epoxidase subunit PaaC